MVYRIRALPAAATVVCWLRGLNDVVVALHKLCDRPAVKSLVLREPEQKRL